MTSTRERPSYLRLVHPDESGQPEPAFRVAIECGGADCDEVVLTIPRNFRLLEEVQGRLGARLRLRRVSPEELTFVIVDHEPGRRLVRLLSRAAS